MTGRGSTTTRSPDAAVLSGAAIGARLAAIAELVERTSDRLARSPFLTANEDAAEAEDAEQALDTLDPSIERLLALDDAALTRMETDTDALIEYVAPVDANVRAAVALTAVGRLGQGTPARVERPAEMPHVPARKADQIRAFVAALPPWPGPFVDWCCGKGHLSRYLARRMSPHLSPLPARVLAAGDDAPSRGEAGAAATPGAVDTRIRCLERDAALCREGIRLAGTAALDFECIDVILDAPALAPQEQVLALHACGHLHDAMLRTAIEGRIRALALAPCCYHLGIADADASWRPLSASGPNAPLPMELARLAVRETVTAPRHVRRRRLEERAFRLGFEALRRTLEPERPRYRSVPSVPDRLIGAGFEAFCTHAAERLGISLASDVDLEPWLLRGQALDARVRRLDLARAPFRRVLELRMVLDRALWLQEQGYAVSVGTFCARARTPRNLMIVAERD